MLDFMSCIVSATWSWKYCPNKNLVTPKLLRFETHSMIKLEFWSLKQNCNIYRSHKNNKMQSKSKSIGLH